MSHVAWSVCLSVCVGHTGDQYKNGLTDRDAVLGLTHVSSRNQVLDKGPEPHGKGHFNVLKRECIAPPRANVPAQRMRRTNAFAAARGDKTTMRPLAKSIWTLFRCHTESQNLNDCNDC